MVSYDGDKYCTIIVEGMETEIKSGYIYINNKKPFINWRNKL